MTSKNFSELNVRVVFCQEGEGWVAQCLEYDIVAQGKTLDVAKDRLGRTLIGQIVVDLDHGRAPLEGIMQAPRECGTAQSPIEACLLANASLSLRPRR